MPPVWKRHALLGWSCLLTLMVLAPTLAPGYTLHLDMVFVPHQTLLPWNLGIGGGLPRSVPQDAVVSLIAGPLPGQVLQKAVLVASLILAAIGAGRLAGDTLALRLPAASIYLWSAYAAARLLMGHWGLLWAFALLPWVLLAAHEARRTGRWRSVAVLCGAGALVPTGGVVLGLAAVPLVVGIGSAVRLRGRLAAVAVVLLFNAPWWLPALRSPVVGVSDPMGLVVFGARADGPGGVLLSVLGGGGVWNSQATLGSRTTWVATSAVVVLVLLAGLGWRDRLAEQRPETVWLTVLAVGGVTWAWLSGVAARQGWAQELVSSVPGGGLLRDGQKWSLFWVLLLAVCAPRGLHWLSRRADRSLRVFLAAALALLPLAALPDLAWGGFGRLRTTQYPSAWGQLRDRLAADARHGDVVTLPWAAFRRYGWNRDTVVLDPLPRYLTRTVVWNDDLPVTVSGELAEVGGDDPRSAAVSAAIDSGRPLAPVLASLGIRWVVVETDQPAATRPPNLVGMAQTWNGPGLQLLEVTSGTEVYRPRDNLVAVIDLVALAMLAGLGVAAVARDRDRGPADLA
ncbi:MAG: hypothetical protein R2720_11310 [Candidatus Nanopelagicales bacterium]